MTIAVPPQVVVAALPGKIVQEYARYSVIRIIRYDETTAVSFVITHAINTWFRNERKITGLC